MSTRDRLTYALGLVVLVLALSVALVACGDSGGDGGGTEMDDDARVAALEDDVAAARDAVARAIADEVGVEFLGGTRRFGWCGESYAPRGVRLDEHLRFAPSALGVTGAVDAAARVLEEHGWAVERAGNPGIVSGSKGAVRVRVDVGPAAVQLDLGNPDCVETADGVARAFAERATEDVVWEDAGSS